MDEQKLLLQPARSGTVPPLPPFGGRVSVVVCYCTDGSCETTPCEDLTTPIPWGRHRSFRCLDSRLGRTGVPSRNVYLSAPLISYIIKIIIIYVYSTSPLLITFLWQTTYTPQYFTRVSSQFLIFFHFMKYKSRRHSTGL